MAFGPDQRQEDGARLRQRAYAQARRHSRRVRLLRFAIPVGALAAAGTVAGFAFLDPFGRLQGLTLGPISVSGSQVTMENPRLNGYRSKSGPYEVTASAATQDVRRPGFVELKDLKARMVSAERGGTARLEAATGLLDTHKERIDLRRNVRFQSENGEEMRLMSAAVDLKAGTVVSHEPVAATFGSGTIEAEGIEVADSGRVMHFKGRVRATFVDVASPSASPSASPLAAPAPQPPARTGEAEADASAPAPLRPGAAEATGAPPARVPLRIGAAEATGAPVSRAPLRIGAVQAAGDVAPPSRSVPEHPAPPHKPARTSQADPETVRR